MNIESTRFGSITIDGEKIDHDVVVYPDGVEERKKRLSKDLCDTSHEFTKKEMEEYLKKVDTQRLKTVVIGTGQYGRLKLLEETKNFLESKKIESIELKTPEAIERFEKLKKSREQILGIFHVTC